ncbi:metallo-beta-lactamase [Lucifera butyrica]|uniref:Metallo-beta-lactamase n=1 Tax=Lucifera butyrica TaxID=1351585 RepID=A0A498R9K6_9FIRM|nr:MBL fold metallo-hydrolase [Lucifera butyrica]VBB07620.1 metallo-beta-lactamase [Lucifera butyrica]
MNSLQAEITYLFHSGYAVKTATHFLIFDYYRPHPPKKDGLTEGVITADFLKPKSNVFVFVSHSHADHFDPAILKWSQANPDITYVLSSDIHPAMGTASCRFLSPYETFSQGGLTVNAFGSTDLGVSFLVKVDHLSIFHAGDLNWWHWKGESHKEQRHAETIFKAEIDKIAGEVIDIAFFPVDRRLEEFYSLGAEYFASKLQPKLLVPMHFGSDFGASRAFAQKVGPSISTVEITREGQTILF